jgi:Peptidase family M23
VRFFIPANNPLLKATCWLASLLLAACSETTHYAPVKVVNQAVRIQHKSSPVSQKPKLPAPIAPITESHPPKHSEVPPFAPSTNVSHSTLGFSGLGKTGNQHSGTQTNPQKTQTPSSHQSQVKQNTKPFHPAITPPKKPKAIGAANRQNAATAGKQKGEIQMAAIRNTPEHPNNDKKSIEKTSTISNNNKKVLKLNFGWPVRGKIIKNFLQSNRKGIDIIGKPGQRVFAAEAGKAVYCGHGLPGYGNLVIIKHNPDYLTAYAHNSKINVSEGQLIDKGQVIGKVSENGSKKALLHFEIRKNGQSVNPLSLLPQN